MNRQLELRIITQPYSEVYWGYFRRLVFANSLTKHIRLSSFWYSVVIFFLPISHIRPCFHANPPDFPRLIGPRGNGPKKIATRREGQTCMTPPPPLTTLKTFMTPPPPSEGLERFAPSPPPPT